MKARVERRRVMVRLPSKQMSQLEKWADDNGTSVTAEILRLVNDRIESDQAKAVG
jgi:hypothetical protein